MGDFEIEIGRHLPEEPQPLQQAKTPTNYDRAKAVAYATFFCNRVCSDAIVMSGGIHNIRKAGELLSAIDPVANENDCTHFISCSMGQPPPFDSGSGTLNGGRMFLDPAGFYKNDKVFVYGMTEPKHFGGYLRQTAKASFAHMDNGALTFDPLNPQFFANTPANVAALKALVQARFTADMGRGDLILYYSDPEKDAGHSALLVNDDWGITCHTSSRCGGVSIGGVAISNFVYMRIKEFREDVL